MNIDHIKWDLLSGNKAVSEDFFGIYFNKIDINLLCLNPGISESFYEKHIKYVRWSALCSNKNIPEQFYEKYINEISVIKINDISNWIYLAQNTHISDEFWERHIEEVKRYNLWYYLCGHISEAFIIKYSKYTYKHQPQILSNPNISEKFITDNIQIGDRIDGDADDSFSLCENPSISLDFLMKHDISSWWVARSPNCNEAYFRDNMGEFEIKFLFRSKNVSEEYFESIINIIDWVELSANTNISEEFFEKYIKYVDLRSLCSNRNMSEKFFIKHKDKIVWYNLCFNENISIKFIKDNIDKIDKLCILALCVNTFNM
jgi:hypothetical protein